jgi:DNA-binding FadR family transcriptional regulator
VLGHYDDRPFPTEAEISQEFATSRSVTREAIKMLTAKGMLSARPRSGIVVQPQTSWSLLDSDVLRWMLERKFSVQLLRNFSELRKAIEPTAAFLAAQNPDPQAHARIEHGLQRMEAAEAGEDDPLAADLAFHVAILDATRNPFFVQFHEMINTALRISIQFTNRIKGHTASVPAHRRVYDGIVSGKPEQAREAMMAIIDEVLVLIDRAEKTTAKSPKRSTAVRTRRS